jgi:hypothetical protein
MAIGIMGLILAAGAALVFKYTHRPPPAPNAVNVITPAPNQPRIARSGGNPTSPPPDLDPLLAAKEEQLPNGIHQLPTGVTLVKAGDAYLKAIRLPEDPAPAFSLGHYSLSADEWINGYLMSGIRRILADPDYARSLAITPDQLKQLEALPPGPAARWPRESRDRLAELYKKWDTAPASQKSTAADQLVKAVGDYAHSKLIADHQAMSQKVAKIRAALTPQQLEKLNPLPRWNLPTTKPATRPNSPP